MMCYFLLVMAMLNMGYGMEVQGHRGSRGTCPENTIPSFQAAIEAGADAVECDVLITRDVQPVVHHDFFLNPQLCTHLELIKDVSLAELKMLDVGRLINPRFPQQVPVPGTTVPTLGELLEFLKGKNVRLNLEIKRDPLHPEYVHSARESAEIIVETVRKSSMAEWVYYASFDPEVLLEVRKIDPQATISMLFEMEYWPDLEGSWVPFLMAMAGAVNAQMVSPDQALIASVDDLRALQQAGFRVILWTVNDATRWAELINMGVDGIITDYPQALNLFLDNVCIL